MASKDETTTKKSVKKIVESNVKDTKKTKAVVKKNKAIKEVKTTKEEKTPKNVKNEKVVKTVKTVKEEKVPKEVKAVRVVKENKTVKVPKMDLETVSKVKDEKTLVAKDIICNESEIKNNNDKKLARLMFNIIFWSAIVILTFVWIIDFVNFKSNKEPKFCVRTVIHQYNDGTVKECNGLGYNIYNYNRISKGQKVEFNPFFIGIDE